MKTPPLLVKHDSPAGPYWYHPDHPDCQDGQVLWEEPTPPHTPESLLALTKSPEGLEQLRIIAAEADGFKWSAWTECCGALAAVIYDGKKILPSADKHLKSQGWTRLKTLISHCWYNPDHIRCEDGNVIHEDEDLADILYPPPPIMPTKPPQPAHGKPWPDAYEVHSKETMDEVRELLTGLLDWGTSQSVAISFKATCALAKPRLSAASFRAGWEAALKFTAFTTDTNLEQALQQHLNPPQCASAHSESPPSNAAERS